MFNVNSWEILIMVALFMILFGPDRLPRVIGQMVKLIRDLQRMSDSATADLRRELEAATRAADITSKPVRRPAPEQPAAAPDGESAAGGGGGTSDAPASADASGTSEAPAGADGDSASEAPAGVDGDGGDTGVVAHPSRAQAPDGKPSVGEANDAETEASDDTASKADVEPSPSIFRKPADSDQDAPSDTTSGSPE